MKKFMCLLLGTMIFLSVMGCDNSSESRKRRKKKSKKAKHEKVEKQETKRGKNWRTQHTYGPYKPGAKKKKAPKVLVKIPQNKLLQAKSFRLMDTVLVNQVEKEYSAGLETFKWSQVERTFFIDCRDIVSMREACSRATHFLIGEPGKIASQFDHHHYVNTTGFNWYGIKVKFGGHDYTGEQLAKFFNETYKKKIKLNTYEKTLRDIALVNGLIIGKFQGEYTGAQAHVSIFFHDKRHDNKKRAYVCWYEAKRLTFLQDAGYKRLCSDFWEWELTDADRTGIRLLLKGIGYKNIGENPISKVQAHLLSVTKHGHDFKEEFRKNLSAFEGKTLLKYLRNNPTRMSVLQAKLQRFVVQEGYEFVLNEKEYPKFKLHSTAIELGFNFRFINGYPHVMYPFREVGYFYAMADKGYPAGYLVENLVYKNPKNNNLHLEFRTKTPSRYKLPISGEKMIIVIPKGDPEKATEVFMQSYVQKDGQWLKSGKPDRCVAPKFWSAPQAVKDYYLKYKPSYNIDLDKEFGQFTIHMSAKQKLDGRFSLPRNVKNIKCYDRVVVIGKNPKKLIMCHPVPHKSGYIYWLYELRGARSYFYSLNDFLQVLQLTKEAMGLKKTRCGYKLYRCVNGNTTLFYNPDKVALKPGFIWHARSFNRIDAQGVLSFDLQSKVEQAKQPYMVIEESPFKNKLRWLVLFNHKRKAYKSFLLTPQGNIHPDYSRKKK